MDTFEYAMIMKAAPMGILVRGNIPQFGGQVERGGPTDVWEHLQVVGQQGWELIAVEPHDKVTTYWLRRRLAS